MTSPQSTPVIPESVLERAKYLFEVGRVADGWAVLAPYDDYAAEAALITGDQPNFKKSIVETLWDIEVGPRVRQDKWLDVAQQHGEQYVKESKIRDGALPSLKFIERSYKRAVNKSDLPASIAIDLTLNNATAPFRVWDDAMLLHELRMEGGQPVGAGLSRGAAIGTVFRTGLLGTGDYISDTASPADRFATATQTEISALGMKGIDPQTLQSTLGVITAAYPDVVATNPKLAGEIAARVIHNQQKKTIPGARTPVRKQQIEDEFNLRVKAYGVPEDLPSGSWGKPAAKSNALQNYRYPSRINAMLNSNQTVDKGNYVGPSQELSPQDLMSPAENRHLAKVARNHLEQRRTKNAFANETSSAYAKIDARAKVRAMNARSPRTDVITAEDGHLTGFAKRHGVTAMDVWHANKDKVPNPNAVQAGVSLNLPAKAQSTQARLDAAYVQIDRENKQRDREIEREAKQAEREQQKQAERVQKAAAMEDAGATLGALPTETVQVAKVDKLGDNAVSAAQDRAATNGRLGSTALTTKSTPNPSFGQSLGSPSGAAPASTSRGSGGTDNFGSGGQARSGGASGGISANTLKTFANTEHHAAIDAARSAQRVAERRANGYTTTTPADTLTFDRAGRLSQMNGKSVKENQTNKALNKDGTYSFDSDGNGAGDAGGTVICSELYRQGLLSHDVYRADQHFGMRLMREDPDVVKGYHAWAKPLVRYMRKSPRFTRVFHKTLAEPWAREMAVREGLDGVGTLRGKVLMALGLSTCRLIGWTIRTCGGKNRTAIRTSWV